MPEFSRELQLLFCRARTEQSTTHTDRIGEILRAGVDWPRPRVLDLANLHAVTPLLYTNLKLAVPRLVPASAMQELRRRNRENTKEVFALTGELLRLLRLIMKQGITAISFKGSTLFYTAFAGAARRMIRDVELDAPF